MLFGWVIFSNEGGMAFVDQLKRMFGVGTDFINGTACFYLGQYLLPIIVFGFIATSIPIRIYKKVCNYEGTEQNNGKDVIRLIVTMVIFTLSVAFLISGSYNPFLYFRF